MAHHIDDSDNDPASSQLTGPEDGPEDGNVLGDRVEDRSEDSSEDTARNPTKEPVPLSDLMTRHIDDSRQRPRQQPTDWSGRRSDGAPPRQ